MDSKNTLSIAYVVVSIIAVAVLVFLLARCKKEETFCSCRNMINRVCPNIQNQLDLYNSGQLTETTDLSKFGKPGWKTIMPEDEYEMQLRNIPYSFQ